jgi:hypothetical protein
VPTPSLIYRLNWKLKRLFAYFVFILVQLGIDVWSTKIFHILFFGKEPEKPREAMLVLKKTAEERWGKWKGYAFVYVLNDLPEISKRIGVDLTRF